MSARTVLALALAVALLAVAHADTVAGVTPLASIPVALFAAACQRARVRDQKSSNPYVIHECDQEGNYVAKQKTVGTPHWFWCYSPDGDVLLGPNRRIQSCACPSERHRLSSESGNPALPACANTGHFEAKQTSDSQHWCVNPNTGAVTKAKVAKTQSLTC